MNLITLTTDFDTQDWFVGTMKGVILGIQPRAIIVDIAHGIPAGDIRAGAFALAASYRFFPCGTVHAAVVDPGVGSQRQAIAVQTADYCFVGPDNGVLSFALAGEKIKTIRRLGNDRYVLRPISNTFHGRDIFAPVTAHLSTGLDLRKLGPVLKDYVRLPWPRPITRQGVIEGEVIYIDRFGNAITNINSGSLPRLGNGSCRISAGRKRSCPLGQFYQAVSAGKQVAVLGSAGFLEISINGGSAAAVLDLKVGDPVTVRTT